eukprot:2507385-Prymnesium_polylepis.1
MRRLGFLGASASVLMRDSRETTTPSFHHESGAARNGFAWKKMSRASMNTMPRWQRRRAKVSYSKKRYTPKSLRSGVEALNAVLGGMNGRRCTA